MMPIRKMLTNALLTSILLALMGTRVLAQYPIINGSPAGRSLLTTGLDQVYDLKFTEAENTFAQLDKLVPRHPAVDLLRGVSLFYQWFPARTSLALQRTCTQQLEKAARKAEDWQQSLKKSGEDKVALPEAMFVYFTAEAMLAKISHYEHETMATVRYAKNAYPFVQKGKAYQQHYPDFYLSTGLYNFYRDVYPEIHPFYKTVAWVMTAGNKNLGMSQLQIATKQALFVRTEAILYLTHLLTDYENRPTEALPHLAQLTVRYPNNPYWRYKYAEALLNAHKMDSVPPLIQQTMAGEAPVYKQMGTLLKARYALETGQRPAARTYAQEVVKSAVREETVRAYAYQVLAKVARLDGQQKLARQYDKLLLEFAEFPVLRNQVN
jgi:hypothetical protein